MLPAARRQNSQLYNYLTIDQRNNRTLIATSLQLGDFSFAPVDFVFVDTYTF